MKQKATTGHLTGSKEITKGVGFFIYELNDRPRRSVLNMFIAPYESRAEFEFCALHTIIPALVVTGLVLISPTSLILLPCFYLAMIATTFVIEKFAEGCGQNSLSLTAHNFKESGKQGLFDLLALPVSTVMMITRSFSTIITKLFSSIRSTQDDSLKGGDGYHAVASSEDDELSSPTVPTAA